MAILNEDGVLDERIQAALATADPQRMEIARGLSKYAVAEKRALAVRESKMIGPAYCGYILDHGTVCTRFRAGCRGVGANEDDATALGCEHHPEGRPVWIDDEERYELLKTEGCDGSNRQKRLRETDNLRKAKLRYTEKGSKCCNVDQGRKCRYQCVQGSDFCWNHGGNLILLDMAMVLAQQEENRKMAANVEVPEGVKASKTKVAAMVEGYLTDPDLLNVRVQVAQAKAVAQVCMEEFSAAVETGEFSEKSVQLLLTAIDGTAKQIERLENIENKKVLTQATLLRLFQDLETIIAAVPKDSRPVIVSLIEKSMFGEMMALPKEQVGYVVPSFMEGEVIDSVV